MCSFLKRDPFIQGEKLSRFSRYQWIGASGVIMLLLTLGQCWVGGRGKKRIQKNKDKSTLVTSAKVRIVGLDVQTNGVLCLGPRVRMRIDELALFPPRLPATWVTGRKIQPKWTDPEANLGVGIGYNHTMNAWG